MSDLDQAIAALRGVPPPPDRVPVRPAGLPPPTAGREKRVVERSEAEMCDKLGDWLRGLGWEVFFEVPLPPGRPDVVGFKGGETLAIEAKRRDIEGVVKQGLRIARKVDHPYVALPFGYADSVVIELAKLEHRAIARGRKIPPMPGVLVVSPGVAELRAPSGDPVDRVSPEKFRRIAERYGAERGGVPSVDQTDRNLVIWGRRYGERSTIKVIANEFSLSITMIRAILGRIEAWRAHLLIDNCSGYPCSPDPDERAFFAQAHRHDAEVRVLVAPPGTPDPVEP